MKNHLNYKIIGQTLDDAAGEAFDKVARILGLGYPGGPAIAKMAMEFPISPARSGSRRGGDKSQFPNKSKNKKYQIPNTGYQIQFPRPMINSKDFNFSFSGLKTAVLYTVKKLEKSGLRVASYGLREHICREFQQSVIDVLVSKTVLAGKKWSPRTFMIAGGVSANKSLRSQLKKAIKRNFPAAIYMEPAAKYSIDNAAMIAVAAFYRWEKMTHSQKKAALRSWKKSETNANLRLR
jgi:N6-L-threonylcarbamoyladenine synthase